VLQTIVVELNKRLYERLFRNAE